jgi:hypothetical protein
MKHRLLGLCCALLLVLSTPVMTLARNSEPDREIVDARLEGYDKINVTLSSGSTALTWILLLVLCGLCVAVMFKDAKRSHLD